MSRPIPPTDEELATWLKTLAMQCDCDGWLDNDRFHRAAERLTVFAALREQIQALSDRWCREPVTHNGEAWARGKCVDELRALLASPAGERRE